MDRFIVLNIKLLFLFRLHLKSNMDRFIVYLELEDMYLPFEFKIQYG